MRFYGENRRILHTDDDKKMRVIEFPSIYTDFFRIHLSCPLSFSLSFQFTMETEYTVLNFHFSRVHSLHYVCVTFYSRDFFPSFFTPKKSQRSMCL